MNVLQINTADTKGGAGKVAYSLKNELVKMGHSSTLLVSRKYSQDNDVKLIRPDSNFRRRALKKLTYYLANDLDLFPAEHILKMPEFKNADIIHCHNLHTNYFNLRTLEKISKLKPVVWTFHDMWPLTAHCAHSFDGALNQNGFFTCPSLDIYPPIAWHNEKYLENKKSKIYTKSNFHIVTPSKWLADKVGQSLLKDKLLTIIYNGIDTNIFKSLPKEQSRQELNLPQDKKIVLIVAKHGQSNPWKGGNHAQEIMNSYKNNSDVYFVDLGGDENKKEGNIETVSYINSRETLVKYYSAADVLLYPSLADNCPLVVLEALASALPVVSFDTGGIPELVEHKKTGYIAKYENTEDLKNGLEFTLGLGNINPINKFNVEKMAADYLSLYNDLIKNYNKI